MQNENNDILFKTDTVFQKTFSLLHILGLLLVLNITSAAGLNTTASLQALVT